MFTHVNLGQISCLKKHTFFILAHANGLYPKRIHFFGANGRCLTSYKLFYICTYIYNSLIKKILKIPNRLRGTMIYFRYFQRYKLINDLYLFFQENYDFTKYLFM